MTRHVDRDGAGWGKLFGKLGEKIGDARSAPPAKKKREKRFKMDKDNRRGMSGRGMLAQYAAAGPMTLEELLARLDVDQRAAVLAMSAEQQAQSLRVWEAFDRHLQAPGSHKAAVLEKLGRSLINGRLLADKRAHGGLLARLAPRVGAPTVGPLRGRVDGLMYLSYIVSLVTEPRPGPAAGRSASEQAVAALTNSLALAWPARWAEIALSLAFGGSWQGIGPVLRPGGAPPDGLIQGSLLAYARTLPPDGDIARAATGPLPAQGDPGRGGPAGVPAARRISASANPRGPGRSRVPGSPTQPGRPQGAAQQPEGPAGPAELTVGQLDLLARILEIDRGAELDVEGRDPGWALVWLAEQLQAGVPARAGIVHDGKGLTVQVLSLNDRSVACQGGLVLGGPAFLGALRRVLVDGDYVSRIGLS